MYYNGVYIFKSAVHNSAFLIRWNFHLLQIQIRSESTMWGTTVVR